MTCIVALRTDKGAYLGADSLGSNTFTGQSYRSSKIFHRGTFLFGISGSYRIMQLFQYHLVIPERPEDTSDEQYIYTYFADAVRSCISDNRQMHVEHSMESCKDGSVIFAYRGRIFKFQSDLSILEPEYNFLSCGSGQYHAEASLYLTEGWHISPEERLQKAIDCASKFVISVNNNVNILFQEGV